MMSSYERRSGQTKLDDKGGIAFPKIQSLPGRPLAMGVGKLKSGAPDALAVIVDSDASGARRELHLRDAKGMARVQKLSETFKASPVSISFHDVDQDGLIDLVVLIPCE